jgi:pimeloyl-ACP methyl ester carboxylesterase
VTAPAGEVDAVSSTDGVTLALHDLGGTGEALLLAHATGFHGRVWGPLARHLPEVHAWAPDLRGHGDSTAPDDESFSWEGFADDVLATVDHLGLHGGIAAGHSKGGAALLLAEQRRPGTFRALYCYEPVVFPPLPEGAIDGGGPLAQGALRRRATFPSVDDAVANYAAKPPLDVLAPEVLRAYVEHGFATQPDGSIALKCRPEHEAQVYRMGAQHRAFERLGQVGCPVTVAVGAVTPYGPAAAAEQIVSALPAGRLEVHPDLGHFGPLEDPPSIAAAIRGALLGER